MPKDTPPGDASWISIVTVLPVDDPGARMKVLRTLESLGVAVMREGVYLLPDTPVNRRAVEHLADFVNRNAGVAHVLQLAASGSAQQQTFRKLFDRSMRYEDLVKNVESLTIGYGIADPSAISRVLHKQRREFEAISGLDFFPSEARERALKALSDAEESVRKLLFPAQSGPSIKAGEKLLRRIWATRRPLWADRLACAWLIRRFVDPEATLIWLDKAQDCPAAAIGFAFEGAQFANTEKHVTFEQMLAKLDLARQHQALVKVGNIVHFLEERGTPVPEAAGVQTLLQGAVRRSANEDELLRETEKTFDLLYEAFYEPPKR